MSRIDDLIVQHCPKGVEFRPLGEIVQILDNLRKPIAKAKRELGEYPYYGANGIQGRVKDFIFDGIFLLLGEDGSVVNKDGSPVLTWAEGKIWVNNHAHVLAEIHDIALLRYVYFYLQTHDVTPIVQGNIPKINQKNLRSISIPVPPLEVQRKIVKTLDTFTKLKTKLEAELEAELEVRRQQYQHYRDALLTFNSTPKINPLHKLIVQHRPKGVEFRELQKLLDTKNGYIPSKKTQTFWIDGTVPIVELGDICNIQKGTSITKAKVTKGKIPVIAGGQQPAYYHNESNRKGKTITISSSGAYAGFVNYFDYPIFVSDCITIKAKDSSYLLTDFIFRLLNAKQAEIYKLQSGAAQPHVYIKDLTKIKISLPPLKVQREIVKRLDKFDALVNGSRNHTQNNGIAGSLLAEIKARRQQYEYYRNRLLTFKKIS